MDPGLAGRAPGKGRASSHFSALSADYCELNPQAVGPEGFRPRRPAPGKGRGPASCRRKGPGPASCRPGGTRPSRHGPGRLWPWREGRVCGRCGGSGTGASRECDGSAPEVRRGRHRRAPRAGPRTVRNLPGWKSAYGAGFQPRGSPVVLPWFEMVAMRPFRTTQAHGRRIRDGDAGNSSLPPVLSNTDLRAAWITRAIGRVIHAARSGPSIRPEKGPSGPGGVTFPASSSRIRPRCGGSPTRSSRKSDSLTSL